MFITRPITLYLEVYIYSPFIFVLYVPAQGKLKYYRMHTNVYKYVAPGTRAAEGSDLDQVLSCLRGNSS